MSGEVCRCGHLADAHGPGCGECRCVGYRRPARKGMRPRRKEGREAANAQEERAKAQWVERARAGRCSSCSRGHAQGVTVRGHHVIRQQAIRRIASELKLRYEALRWDPRNELLLCDDCHERHHSGAARLSLGDLKVRVPTVFAFVEDLDSRYPRDQHPAEAEMLRSYPNPNA